jgi:imidazolonepropionase-like amidohydrolase
MGQLAALRKELDAARDGPAVAARPEGRGDRGAGGDDGSGGADEQSARGASASTGRRAMAPPGNPVPPDTQQRGRRGGGRGQAPAAPEGADAALIRAALTKLLKGETLAFIYCELAMDVPQAIKLAKEYKLKAVLVLAPDCHKAVNQVAAAKLPVVLDPTLVTWETDPRTGEERQVILPKIYREAGVPVMFQVGGFAAGTLFRTPNLPPTLGTNSLWYQAATAIKYGAPPDEALKAITQLPAQTLGVEKLVGTIEPGKDADLVILTGDPLKLDTWVQTMIIGGKVVYERDQDRKLQKLLRPTDKP